LNVIGNILSVFLRQIKLYLLSCLADLCHNGCNVNEAAGAWYPSSIEETNFSARNPLSVKRLISEYETLFSEGETVYRVRATRNRSSDTRIAVVSQPTERTSTGYSYCIRSFAFGKLCFVLRSEFLVQTMGGLFVPSYYLDHQSGRNHSATSNKVSP